MATHDLASLQREAQRQETAKKTRLRYRYHLAKQLGFSAAEAKILQGHSEKHIRQLAAEKKAHADLA